MKKIEVCHIQGARDKTSELLLWFKCSKSLLKKTFSKKELLQEIKAREVLSLSENFVNHGRINPLYRGEKVQILFEDQNILVLNKPPKIHMHPLTYGEHDNLLSFLRQENKDSLLEVNEEGYDRGLLFRLDYETSGIVFFAKTQKLYDEVRQNFSLVTKKKEYYAVVTGKVEKLLHLEDKIKGFGIKNSKMREDDLGELAELVAKPLAHNTSKNLTLLKVELITGLRHQIRFQLAHAGYPILGDSLYGGAPAFRLFLHASRYHLKLADTSFDFEAPVDGLFQSLFDFD